MTEQEENPPKSPTTDPANVQRFHQELSDGTLPSSSDLLPYNDKYDITTHPTPDGGEMINFWPRTSDTTTEDEADP